MDEKDVKIIAGRLLNILNDPKNVAEAREDFIHRLRNSPEDLDPFLFNFIDQYAMFKAVESDVVGVCIQDMPKTMKEVKKELIRLLDEQAAA